MSSASSEITNAATYTAIADSQKPKETGAASKLTSDDFLKLMMQQLQYQDPLKPTDNAQFIAEQAQFTQLSTTQEMSKSISTNNSIMQTLTLVGKQVDLSDPSDSTKTISGVVSEAKFTSSGANIMVDGKEYPISLVKSVKSAATSTTTGS